MKFLLIVMGVRFLIGLLGNNKNSAEKNAGLMEELIRHPAEFELR